MLLRIAVYIVGVLILGLGLVLNTKAQLGISAISSFPYALSRMTALSFGMATASMYFVFVAAQLAIRRRVDGKTLLQIPFSYVMGVIIDFYDANLALAPESLAAKLLVLALAIFAIALGVFMTVGPDFVPNPSDGITAALAQLAYRDFGTVKVFFDCTMMALTTVTTLLVARKIIGIGIGTVLSALFIGRVIRIFNNLMGPKLMPIVEQSRKKE